MAERATSLVPVAATSTLSLSSLTTFAGVGAGIGRTLAMMRLFRRPQGLPWNVDTVAGGALAGGLVGMVILVTIGIAGTQTLPDWIGVPAVVVSVQAGYSLALGYLLTRELGPLNGGIGPTHADFAFALYGMVTLPGLALFVVTMTVANILR